jgi:hypothetical protein
MSAAVEQFGRLPHALRHLVPEGVFRATQQRDDQGRSDPYRQQRHKKVNLEKSVHGFFPPLAGDIGRCACSLTLRAKRFNSPFG